MSWGEFTDLLSGLPAESQLVRVITVRTAEGDELKALPPAAIKLRDEWYAWLNSQETSGEKQADAVRLQGILKSLFYERR